ncbi:MAG TPA: DUF397 domain-containing protein [Mycobacteriales bacterium]|nr:DUF397 domain-containing protein [Mycobacteriales bacterium]
MNPQVDLSRAVWHKSSRSSGNGACVEVAVLDGAVWHKSSYSSGNGQCVEVAALGTAVAVRDSKNPTGPVLTFTPGQWTGFLDGVRADRFTSR